MKSLTVKSFFLATALPAVLFAASGPASAQDADVTWANQITGDCLRYNDDGNVWTNPANKDYACQTLGGSLGGIQWHDDNSNLENYDGAAWAEKTPGPNGRCLTAYDQVVYTEPCSGPVNYYEQWYEEWDGNLKGFRLKNRMSQRYLTADNNGHVSMTGWANDRHQIWK